MTGHATVDTLLLIAAVVTALTVIYRGGKSLLKFIRKVSAAFEWLAEIHYQLTPNGGDSIVDLLQRVDENDQVTHRNNHTIYGVVLKQHKIDPKDAPLLENILTRDEQRRRRGLAPYDRAGIHTSAEHDGDGLASPS